jgi:glycerophosphoryl diester phosphodiesterase
MKSSSGVRRVFALSALCFATLLSTMATAAETIDRTSTERTVFNIGHRGSSGSAPEHTLASYDLALREGADYIEQDLQMTRDGALVVLHDSTLDRTARGPAVNCSGAVADKTLEQIKTCDVGSWFNEAYPNRARPEYEGLMIPTLQEVFERYGRGVNYYIEVKDPASNPGIEEALLRVVDAYGLATPAENGWRVLIQSFFPTSLQRIHALRPELPLIQLYPGFGSEAVASTFEQTAEYAVGVGPSMGDVDMELIDSAHESCLQVHPYTVNSPREMRHAVSLGVDGMFTDFPTRLNRVLGNQAIARPLRAGGEAASASELCRAG